jgi:NAD+ synthase (glutamine-hydrolysing)
MVVEELHPDLRVALEKVRDRRNFQIDEWIEKKTDLFNEYMSKNKLKACLVNLSGGVDSAVTLALMVAASKKSNSPIQRVLGISQPIHSTGTYIKCSIPFILFLSFIYNGMSHHTNE